MKAVWPARIMGVMELGVRLADRVLKRWDLPRSLPVQWG